LAGNVILVEQESGVVSDICLLDGTQQELFRMSEPVDDPEIMTDARFHARDFVDQYLAGTNGDSQTIIRQAIGHCRLWLSKAHQLGYLER
jgi:hypothetical protein